MKKILLHCCCAVCAGYPLQLLRMLDYDVTAYFYNPNIYPEGEYFKRLEMSEKFCEKYNFELIKENYNPEEFYEAVKGFENEPEGGLRCNECFKLRLKKTAQKARELKIPCFTTSLTVSPHKNFNLIARIAKDVAGQAGVDYKEFDFKKNNGFKITYEIAKFNGMYIQNYCGCEFASLRKCGSAKGMNKKEKTENGV